MLDLNHQLNLFITFLPMHLANGAPVLFSLIPFLKPLIKPVDAGKTFRNKRIFGEHKTWLGLFSGFIAGTISGFIISSIPTLNLPEHTIFGMVTGTLAIFGDMTKSFFKRQIGILPGKPWIPFDQIDYLLYVIPFSIVYLHLPTPDIISIFAQGFFLAVTVSYSSYLLGIKERFF